MVLKNVKLELNEAYQKVLLWFFSFPAKWTSLSLLSDNLKISKTTANKIVGQLIKEGFLKKEVYGKTWRITSNREHEYNLTKKIAYNLMMIRGSNIVDEINKKIGNSRVIILFGSYQKGDDNEKSDIDIAVEVIDNKKLEIKELGIISKFMYRKDVKVNLHIFSRKNVDINLFSNIANGIVLDGFLEVKP